MWIFHKSRGKQVNIGFTLLLNIYVWYNSEINYIYNSGTYMPFPSLTREGHICPSSPVRVKTKEYKMENVSGIASSIYYPICQMSIKRKSFCVILYINQNYNNSWSISTCIYMTGGTVTVLCLQHFWYYIYYSHQDIEGIISVVWCVCAKGFDSSCPM